MDAQALLQPPPQLFEDSASNHGSSVAGDCFDEDFLSDAGRDSPSNADSLAEDSDDEPVAGSISSADMARLRILSHHRYRDHRCDCHRDNARQSDPIRIRIHDTSSCDRDDDDDDDALVEEDMSDGGSVYHPLVTILPRGAKPVRLVGEGAANAVFEIKVPPGSRVGAQFQGTALFVHSPCRSNGLLKNPPTIRHS